MHFRKFIFKPSSDTGEQLQSVMTNETKLLAGETCLMKKRVQIGIHCRFRRTRNATIGPIDDLVERRHGQCGGEIRRHGRGRIKVKPSHVLPHFNRRDLVWVGHPVFKSKRQQSARKRRKGPAAMGNDESDVREVTEKTGVDHLGDGLRGLKRDINQRVWSSKRTGAGRRGMGEHSSTSAVQLSPDWIERGVAQVDAVIATGDCEAVGVELVSRSGTLLDHPSVGMPTCQSVSDVAERGLPHSRSRDVHRRASWHPV